MATLDLESEREKRDAFEKIGAGKNLSREQVKRLEPMMTPADKIEWMGKMHVYVRETFREILSLVHPEWCDAQVRIQTFCRLELEREYPMWFKQSCCYQENIEKMKTVSREALAGDRFKQL